MASTTTNDFLPVRLTVAGFGRNEEQSFALHRLLVEGP